MTGRSAAEPYQTEREAVAAARAVIPPHLGWSILSQEQHYVLVHQVLAESGVETSRFEDRTAWWLANYDDNVTAIIARWVSAAYEAGKAAALAGAATQRSASARRTLAVEVRSAVLGELTKAAEATAVTDYRHAADAGVPEEEPERAPAETGATVLHRMIAAYVTAQASGKLRAGMTLAEFTGLDVGEYEQWAASGEPSARWLRMVAAGRDNDGG